MTRFAKPVFYGESGKTYYIKLTTQGYNTLGGGVIIPYKWLKKKVIASISGTVTFSDASPAQGKLELYSVKTGKVTPVETTNIQANGTYRFDNIGIETYKVRAVSTNGDIAGRRLISQNSQPQIYIGGLPQGIYLVKAGNKTAKFIKR